MDIGKIPEESTFTVAVSPLGKDFVQKPKGVVEHVDSRIDDGKLIEGGYVVYEDGRGGQAAKFTGPGCQYRALQYADLMFSEYRKSWVEK